MRRISQGEVSLENVEDYKSKKLEKTAGL